MFLTKDWILTAELAQKLKITINNFSPWYQQYPDLIGTDIIKLGECMFVRKDSIILGEFYEAKIKEFEFTDFTNKVPLTYLKAEFKFNPKYCENKLGKIIDIAGKKFFEFDYDFAYKNRRKAWYPMTKEEFLETNEFRDCITLDVAKKHLIILY